MKKEKLSARILAVVMAIGSIGIVPAPAEHMEVHADAVSTLGDTNGDGFVDASDAADILYEAALLGAGEQSHYTEAQIAFADVDTNGSIDASDAAFVLQYAAVAGSGSQRTMDDFMYQELLPVKASALPAFAGEPYTIVNNGEPFFTVSDYDISASFEDYSVLDSLGRCRIAFANLGQDLMPTEERGDISAVKPTGWQSVPYDIVDGGYLYNRCHLIGFQLAGENANELNLITGTRYMNTEGMLPFENQIANYIRTTDYHVLYRVTPVFTDDNLVADGVLMEALSVEDGGAGICFNVYCYNIQPGIVIDYANGNNWLADGASTETTPEATETTPESTETEPASTETTPEPPETTTEATQTVPETTVTTTAAPETTTETTTTAAPETQPATQPATSAGGLNRVDQSVASYIANTNTKKFHRTSCGEISKIKAENFAPVSNSKAELEALGYVGCKKCNP